MNNILLAVDYTDNTNKVVSQALEIAARFKSKVWIIHAVDTYSFLSGYGGITGTTLGVPEAGFVGMESGAPVLMDEENRELLLNTEQEKLQRLAEDIRNQGFSAEIILTEGDATDAILSETERLRIELIVIGFHEHGFLYNTFVGSTTEALIKKSKVPVLIVPEEKAKG